MNEQELAELERLKRRHAELVDLLLEFDRQLEAFEARLPKPELPPAQSPAPPVPISLADLPKMSEIPGDTPLEIPPIIPVEQQPVPIEAPALPVAELLPPEPVAATESPVAQLPPLAEAVTPP